MNQISITLIVLQFLFQNLYSRTINIPNDQPMIQVGIVSSSNGDTILVSPGTYYENINFNGKNIVLGSLFLTTGDTSYISQTVIDGNHQGCVVVIENGEDSTAILTGFTITNGLSDTDSLRGGGITCINSSSPKLTNLIVANNEIIGMEENYGGGGIYCHRQSSPKIVNVVIRENKANQSCGVGIYCRDSSNISMVNVIISENEFAFRGGGLAIVNSSITITKSQIVNNSAKYGGGIFLEKSTIKIDSSKIQQNVARNNGSGGGIWAKASNILIEKSDISNNSAIYKYSSLASFMSEGGGLYLRDCSVIIENSNISYNICENDGGGFSIHNGAVEIYSTSINNNGAVLARASGGGMYIVVLLGTSIYLEDVVISDNYSYGSGGGIAYGADEINEPFKNVVIKNNSAEEKGGGIAATGNLMIAESSGCSIFSNKAKEEGSDIYMYFLDSNSTYEINLDTVTVSDPDNYHIYPIKDIDLHFKHALFQSVNSDLYVSPSGSDSNSGITQDDPLKSINMALLVAKANSFNHRTIYLGPGTYSASTTNEEFPLIGRSYISIKGDKADKTILDGENENNLISLNNCQSVTLENFTVQNGHEYYGGGIYINGQKILLRNLLIKDNYAEKKGGGLYIYNSEQVDLTNLTITQNNSNLPNSDGGIGAFDTKLNGGGNISIFNCLVHTNTPINLEIGSIGLYTALIGNSNIEGGEDGLFIDGESVVVHWLEGNIDADPLFLGGNPFDYNLSDNSPCINAGTPFLVWEGDTLINLSPSEYIGEAPDMGALESDVLISVEKEETLPTEFKLEQNYPNPFNPSTTIKYSIPNVGNEKFRSVQLIIYDILGREVTTLVNKEQKSGNYEVKFDARNLSSGIYFYRINAGKFFETKKLLLLK